MADIDHAPLAPSSAARLVACTGSRMLAARYPQEPTIETREGEAAHWAGAELIQNRPVAIGQLAANGVTLTDEMIEAAEMYAEHIQSRKHTLPGHVERLVRNAALHPQNYGTPDHVNMETMHLFIDDFKYGHRYVEVFENWQLIDYTALVLAEMGVDDEIAKALKVTMTIVQPRCYHRGGPIRTWTVLASELRPYFDVLRNKFEEAMRDDAPCTVNPECEFCTGRWACEAATAGGFKAVEHAYSSAPLRIPPAAAALELRTLRRAETTLKARISGLEEQLLAACRRGQNVPFFSVEHGQGRTVWTSPPEEVISLGAMLGVNVSKPGTITPKQAIKAGLDAEVVKLYSDTPRGAAQLVEDDGKTAAKVFK